MLAEILQYPYTFTIFGEVEEVDGYTMPFMTEEVLATEVLTLIGNREHQFTEVVKMIRNRNYDASGFDAFLLIEQLSILLDEFNGKTKGHLLMIYNSLKRQAYAEGKVNKYTV
jgi:hypothetical protein